MDYGGGIRRQPGWSIWGGGKWRIPDGDKDNIPGNAWEHYPRYGQKKLCALNPRNPGCRQAQLDYGAGINQQPGWSIWGDGDVEVVSGQAQLCALNPANPGC